MSAAPGWYADPSLYGGTRWWDGVQWTSHATPPPGQGHQPAQAYQLGQPQPWQGYQPGQPYQPTTVFPPQKGRGGGQFNVRRVWVALVVFFFGLRILVQVLNHLH